MTSIQISTYEEIVRRAVSLLNYLTKSCPMETRSNAEHCSFVAAVVLTGGASFADLKNMQKRGVLNRIACLPTHLECVRHEAINCAYVYMKEFSLHIDDIAAVIATWFRSIDAEQ